MLNVAGTLTWMLKKTLRWWSEVQVVLLAVVLGVLDISGCLLKFGLWIVIFSLSSILNLLGVFFLAGIWILGQITRLFERRRRRHRQVGNRNASSRKRLRSQDGPVRNGYNVMDYDTVMRTTRGLYTCRPGVNRSKSSSLDYWFPERQNGFDSSYYTETPRSVSSASWSTSRSRFPRAII